MIRPSRLKDAAAIARVQVDTWRTTYRGLMPETVLAHLDAGRRTEVWQRILEDRERHDVFVVVEGGNVVGFVSGGPESNNDPVYTGELYALYVLEAQQKRGLGKTLFLRLIEALLGREHKAMLLWVLSTNPARAFYETLGGQVLKTKPLAIGGETLEETAYSYDDLEALSSKYSSASA